MRLNRRLFSLGLGAVVLSGCASGGTGRARPAGGASGLPADLRPQRNAGYDAWVQDFRPRAQAQGISQRTLDQAFRGAGFLPGVVKRDRNQTEFKRTLEDYLAIAASDKRIAMGREMFARHRRTLSAIEARYGVDPSIMTAIWGLESFYGTRMGDIPVISATSTLAFEGRRGRFFEAQLMDALRIIQAGDIPAAQMRGSWAGAMGHTQFIPTTFTGYAVDFDGDGRRDIWNADPADALAGTANYLAQRGWQRGGAWAQEDPGGAFEPQAGGPRFTLGPNFRVIKRYNNSDSYAIGVGHLADRIRGAGPLRGQFPPDEFGLTKQDRVALQQGLTRRGFDAGEADGIIGTQTRTAIEGFQRRNGLPVTGTPSRDLLRRL
ncbi:lytic murein transglycosylase [Primorskyibacter sp. S187A]|uniref:lytic murein transglycosylase n=1 Tax=Primorskyibacter sp. S187A TaxID=3415130 RepID=UPI003C7BDC4B